MAKRVFKLPRQLSKFPPARRLSNGLRRGGLPPYVEDAHYGPLDDWVDDPAEEAIRSLGINAPVRPTSDKGRPLDPRMPADVTRLTNRQLGTLYAQFVAMCEWLDWETAKAGVNSAGQDSYVKHVVAEVRLRQSGTVPDKDAKTLKNPRTIAEDLESLRRNARYRLLRARVSGYERCAAALSREMTRRELDQRHD